MIRFVLTVVCAIQVLLIPVYASAVEIHGIVTLGVSEQTPGKQGLAGVVLHVFSPANVQVAQGKADEQGQFQIQTDWTGEEGSWLIVEAESSRGSLRGLYTGRATMTVNPVSEALAGAIFKTSSAPENFTSHEVDFIQNRLDELALAIDMGRAETATGTVEALLTNERFRLALGDLVYSYDTPGDTVEDVNALNTALDQILPVLFQLDRQTINQFIASDAKIEIEDGLFSGEDLFKKIAEINTQYQISKWVVDYVRTRVHGDEAEVETVENITLVNRGENSDFKDRLNFINEMVRKDGRWILTSRQIKQCVPVKATIFAQGSAWDWVGVRPCLMNYKDFDSIQGKTASANSLYFAVNESGIAWRMELVGSFFDAARSSDPVLASYQNYSVAFMLLLRDKPDDSAETKIFSIVGVKKGVSYALNQIQRIALDGFPEDLVYLPDNFAVSSRSVQGAVSWEELKASGNEFVVNSLILHEKSPGQSVTISEGTPTKIKLVKPVD